MTKKSPRSSTQKAQVILTSPQKEWVDDGKRHRGWCLTIYNDEEMEKLKEEKSKYCIIGKEHCPTTQKIHYQCYINLTESKEFSTLKKIFKTAHMEAALGSDEQNKKYCSKENMIFESGTPKHQGKKVTPNELKKMTNEDIIEMDPRCHKAYIHARDLLNNDIDIDEWEKKVEIFYIWGESGVGKTEKAKQIVRDNKEKYGTQINRITFKKDFYQGVGSAKIAIYDDWRDNHMKPDEFINLIDYNKQVMNIKGGEKINDYELIIITSVQDPKKIYKGMTDEEPRQQWERRIKTIHLEHKEE